MESYQIDWSHPAHIHFIGIGGISMSGLAEILLHAGFRVSGSDSKESSFTDRLTGEGAEISYGQKAENLSGDIDCVVYTAAIHPDNPEYRAAEARGIPMLSRAQFLGEILRRYPESIAVSGTHGKTTTTSMIAHILLEAKRDPTISVGGVLPLIGGNIRIGGDDTFLLEACEYTNSFLSFYPKMEIILNIEADHLDFFHNIENIRNSFHRFVGNLPDNGTLIIDSRIRNYGEICAGFPGTLITVSGKNADYTADGITFDAFARPAFTAYEKGRALDRLQLRIPGEHNVYNALAAIAAGRALGIDFETIRRGLEAFAGAARRFEKKGDLNGIAIVDDYAHHPQEIEATLKAALKCPHKKLWCVFQPHTYTRTKALLPDFAAALSLADRVVLADIFAAREKNTIGVSSGDIADLINEKTPGKAVYLPSFDKIETYLLEHLEAGDLCLTMGAGDIYKVGEHLLGK